ncbi:MAG: PLP-dependent aminotransferase family protein [Clostridia bacterium]|nr:PLP-dependent aminotransferase family protein [Clostridia bacterium]
MRYKTDKSSAVPAYMQLYYQIKSDITDGVIRYGDRLPSKRTLCEEAGCSVITAEHAYAILCDEGYAEARERSGYFVIYRETDFNVTHTPRKTPSPARAPSHSGTGDFPFSVIAKTMRRVILDRGEDIMVKPDNKGCFELRDAICSYLGRSNGMKAEAEQVIVGAGAEYLYGLAAQLLGRDRTYALEEPSYEQIRRVYGANGIKYELLPLGPDGITTEALASSRAGVLHITPFHSYPSGVTASASKRREYLAFAKERGGYIIEDNYDSELTVSRKNEDTVFSLSDDGRVVYINTFSMTVAPSLRLGYMVLPETLLPDFDKKLGFYSCTVPVFEQFVLAELLNNGDFERHINRLRRAKRKQSRTQPE